MSRWDNIKSSGEQSLVPEKQEGSLGLNSATKPKSVESLLELETNWAAGSSFGLSEPAPPLP